MPRSARAVAQFEADIGPTDILINNAGWDKFAYFLATEPDLWRKILAINLEGPLNLHHAVLKGMQARRSGRVVNIASDAGRVGSSMEAVYSSAKGGIIAFTKTMAREMARAGVTLNVVCPGPTETPLLDALTGDRRAGREGPRRPEAGDTARPARPARRHRRHRRLPRERRSRLHHRPGHQRFWRPDHAWLGATPDPVWIQGRQPPLIEHIYGPPSAV